RQPRAVRGGPPPLSPGPRLRHRPGGASGTCGGPARRGPGGRRRTDRRGPGRTGRTETLDPLRVRRAGLGRALRIVRLVAGAVETTNRGRHGEGRHLVPGRGLLGLAPGGVPARDTAAGSVGDVERRRGRKSMTATGVPPPP